MAEGAKGKVVQVIGTVVDVEFPPEELPEVYNSIEINVGDGQKVVAEVQQHLGNNWVRCLAMDSTDGMRRGAECVDAGAPIAVPVGEACLGRLFNVMGQAIDGLGAVETKESWPIHRPSPSFEERETTPQILETGLKVLDLVSPFTKGERWGLTAGPVWARPSLSWS